MPEFFRSIPPTRMRLVLRILGLVILLAGYVGAAAAWRMQDRIDRENAILEANGVETSASDSRSQSRQIESMYGKSGLLADDLMNWIKSLTRGRGLAETLVVLSSATVIICFIVAGHWTFDSK
jgi:hypothetical protein